MAPAIGRLALDNGSCGSIPGDWVAPPPQNIPKNVIDFLSNLLSTLTMYFIKVILRSEHIYLVSFVQGSNLKLYF